MEDKLPQHILRHCRYFCFLFALFILALQIQCQSLVLRITYNYADDLLLQKIDEYFNINDKQEVYLQEKLKALHQWHRQKQLPAYHNIVGQLNKYIEHGIQPKNVRWASEKVRSFAVSLVKRTYDSSLDFLFSLNEKQINYLEKKLSESNQKLEERSKLSRAEALEKKKQKMLEITADWLGSISSQQEKIFTARIKRIPDITKERLSFRYDRQKLFISALRKKEKQPQVLKKLVRNWTLHYHRTLPSNYRRASLRVRRHYEDYALLVFRQANTKQLNHTIDKLASYHNLIHGLFVD